MNNKKLFQKLLIASLTIGSLTFIENIYFNSFPIISIAHAEIREYTGTDTAMFDFGENDEKIVNTVKSMARLRAELAAKEKAGVYIKSYSKSMNNILSEDEISTITNRIVEVVNVEYKQLPYEAYNVSGKSYGKIGFMYEASVTVKIDNNGISNYLKHDQKDKIKSINQNNALQKSIENNNNEFEVLRKQSETATTEQERNNIKSELNKVDKDFLYNQKLEEAGRFIENNNYNGAIGLCNEAMQIKPNAAEAYFMRGIVYDNLNKFDLAIKDYNRVIQINQNPALSAFTYIIIGGYYHSVEEDDETAIANYNKAIQINANDTLTALAYNARGFAYQYDNEKQSIADHTKAIQLYPDFEDAYYNRGEVYSDWDFKEYNKALDDYNKAIQINPKYIEAYKGRAGVYEKLKQYDKALTDYNKMVEIEPTNASVYHDRGFFYYNWLKQYDKALIDYNKMIELNPTSDFYYSYRAKLYVKLKQYDKAITDYNKIIELEPTSPFGYGNRANLYKELKQYDKAIADYTKAIQIDPQNDDYYNGRGDVYYDLEDYNKAIADYTKAIQIKPDWSKSYNNRGWIYYLLKDYKQAIEDFNKAIQVNPKYANAYDSRGCVYYALNDYNQAINDFNKAISLNPNFSGAYHNRGLCYQAINENEKAQADFNKAKMLGYSN